MSDPSMSDLLMESKRRVEAQKEAYGRGIAEGERRERAAVVAWLRDMAPTFRGVLLLYRDALMWAAERIEAGEHKETSEKANEDRCPYPGCTGVKDHVECPTCGEGHCLRCFE